MTEQQNLKPCPFCGSRNVDPTGWASTEREGPACDDCGSSADTVAEWNTRPEEDRLLNEIAAMGIYDKLPYDGPAGTAKPAWVPFGNSLKQDEARRLARATEGASSR